MITELVSRIVAWPNHFASLSICNNAYLFLAVCGHRARLSINRRHPHGGSCAGCRCVKKTQKNTTTNNKVSHATRSWFLIVIGNTWLFLIHHLSCFLNSRRLLVLPGSFYKKMIWGIRRIRAQIDLLPLPVVSVGALSLKWHHTHTLTSELM